jgi:hypothetical protein
MSLAYTTNRLRRFGYQLVRNETLLKLLVPPVPAPQQHEVSEQRFWDLGEHRGIVRATNGVLICIDTRDTSLGHAIRRTLHAADMLAAMQGESGHV